MNRSILLTSLALLAALAPAHAGGNGKSGVNVLRRPLSKVEALNIAIGNNGTILQAQKEVEAVAGIAIQTRAILLPKVTNSAKYALQEDSLIEGNQSLSSKFVGAGTNNQAWSGDIQVVQSIYEGGRMRSAARSSKLIQEQALLVF